MTQPPVYTDPARRHQRLSLLGELTKLSSRPARVPAEDQLTAAVAWLADHAEVFARALCDLILEEEDGEGRDALARSLMLGADVQVRLPSIGGGLLWADLSIAGTDRAFQLLVEVKLGCGFHEYSAPGLHRRLAQPEAYLHAWRSCDMTGEARVRRLGTLTLDGTAPPGNDPWRARDIAWLEVHRLLEALCPEFGPEVQLVAGDLRRYLGGRVLPPVVDPEFLARGSSLARGVCERLRERVVDGTVSGNFAINERFHYTGGYLEFTSPDKTREKLWLVVTPAGGDYNVPGAPASIQMASVYEEPLTADAKARLVGAGFAESKDRIGYRLLRAALPLSDLDDQAGLDDQILIAAAWAEELLCAGGFIRPKTSG